MTNSFGFGGTNATLRWNQRNPLAFKIWILINSGSSLEPSMGIKALSDDFFWHITYRDGERLYFIPALPQLFS
jgi:hypothetical protein